MRVAADGSDARHLEVEWREALAEAGTLGKGDDEGAEAAVDVAADVVAFGECSEFWDGVLVLADSAMNEALTTMPSGKLGADPTTMMVLGLLLSAAPRHNYSHVPLHEVDIGLAGTGVDRNNMQLDFEVLRCFPECGVGGRRDDPGH